MPAPNVLYRIDNGYGRFIEQSVRYAWDTRTGWQTIRTFKGAYRYIAALLPGLQAQGYNFTMDPVANGANYVLTATVGLSFSNGFVTDNPVDVWELTSNKVEKDLLQSDIPIINSLSPADIATIRDNYQQPPATAPTFQDATNAPLIYNLMVAGETAITVFAPVLRHTQTISGSSPINNLFTNVRRIVSTATLAPAIPAALSLQLPVETTTKTGFTYGWLIDYPNVTVSAFNKTQIQQDYQYGLWTTTIYGAAL